MNLLQNIGCRLIRDNLVKNISNVSAFYWPIIWFENLIFKNLDFTKSYFFQFADIARQMIESAPGNQTDVILGGGMLSFKNGSNSNPKWVCSRQDGRDLIKGYKIDYFNLRILKF